MIWITIENKRANRYVHGNHLEVNENQIKEIVIACWCCYFLKVKVLEQKLAKFARSAKPLFQTQLLPLFKKQTNERYIRKYI